MLPDRRSAAWIIEAASKSDVGRVRHQNEDRCLVDLQHNLFIVADGIGGHRAGEVAAEAIVTVLPTMLQQHVMRYQKLSSNQVKQLLRETIRALSQRLRTESQARMGLEGMGATVVVAWLYGHSAYLAHMGDSRIYLLRQDYLSQMTQDHTVLALLLRKHEITPEAARSHPARGRLSRYVGMEGDVSPDVQQVPLYDRDRLLLCTDGLTNMVSDSTITQLLLSHPDPASACEALIDSANEAGGKDNITVLVINCRAIQPGHTGKTTANIHANPRPNQHREQTPTPPDG
jgi:serine/threonine protein phosphatase PrpC